MDAGQALNVQAGNDIMIESGQQQASVDEYHKVKKTGFLSNGSVQTLDVVNTLDATQTLEFPPI